MRASATHWSTCWQADWRVQMTPEQCRVRLLALFLAARPDSIRHGAGRARVALDVEPAAVAEEAAPARIRHLDLDPEQRELVVEPFVDVRNAREQHWETESDSSLVEALLAGAQTQAARLRVDRELDVDGEVLVCAEVVDDPAALFTPDHVRVEAALDLRESERSDPRDGLTSERVKVGIVLDRERHVVAAGREHDSPPSAQGEKRQRVRPAEPDFVHRAASDLRELVGAGNAEALLYPRMEAVELLAQRLSVDRHHGGRLRHRRARGRSRRRASSGVMHSSSQRRKRSKLHAVAQPRSGRNTSLSIARPSRPKRVP